MIIIKKEMKMKRAVIIFILLIISNISFIAEVFILRDKTVIFGEISTKDENMTLIITKDGEINIETNNIELFFSDKEEYDKYILNNSEEKFITVKNSNSSDDEKKQSKFYTIKELIDYNPFHKNHDLEEKFWRRNFFNINLIGGISFLDVTSTFTQQYSTFSMESDDLSNGDMFIQKRRFYNDISGCIGLSFSYLYGLNSILALGVGFSGVFSFGHFFIDKSYFDMNNNKISLTEKFSLNRTDLNWVLVSGASVTFNMMIGDIKKKKIAFLLDVGTGMFLLLKIGIYIKGFLFKIGYNSPLSISQFNELGFNAVITFDIGYMINWAYKPKKVTK